jgi:hypothetical protein
MEYVRYKTGCEAASADTDTPHKDYPDLLTRQAAMFSTSLPLRRK